MPKLFKHEKARHPLVARSVTTHIVSGLGLLLLSASTSLAEGAYHWKDSAGRDHYGSNPPKDARSVEPLGGKSFSKYSAEKLMKPYRGMAITEPDMRSRLNSPEDKKGAEYNPIKPPVLPPIVEEALMPELSQGDLIVRHDEQNRVTSCSVVVKNAASIPANGVLVSFEFEDGTLVPGSGPESIDADSTAKYAIADSLLPISVTGEMKPGGPKPKVSIRGGGIR